MVLSSRLDIKFPGVKFPWLSVLPWPVYALSLTSGPWHLQEQSLSGPRCLSPCYRCWSPAPKPSGLMTVGTAAYWLVLISITPSLLDIWASTVSKFPIISRLHLIITTSQLLPGDFRHPTSWHPPCVFPSVTLPTDTLPSRPAALPWWAIIDWAVRALYQLWETTGIAL